MDVTLVFLIAGSALLLFGAGASLADGRNNLGLRVFLLGAVLVLGAAIWRMTVDTGGVFLLVLVGGLVLFGGGALLARREKVRG